MRYTSTMWLAAAMLSLAMLVPTAAEASHFRFGSITYRATATPGTVDIVVRLAYRGSYFNALGQPVGNSGIPGGPALGTQIQTDATLNFGDGQIFNAGSYTMPVIARSTAEDWLIVERTFTKTYAAAGPYIVTLSGCCRISAGSLVNAPDAGYQLRTTIRPQTGNSSPVPLSIPVVYMAPGSASTFLIAASDANNDNIRYRLATPLEASNNQGAPYNVAPGVTINSTTGVLTWNNLAAVTNRFYTVQVIVEDLDGSNAAKSQAPVDFLIRVANVVGTPPTIAATPAGPFKINVGSPFAFTVTATDPDPGAVLDVTNTGLPSGATMSPAHPTQGGSPQNSTFNWTPTVGQEGNYTITYIAIDNNSNQALTSVQINVNRPPTAYAGDPQVLECSGTGQTATLDGSGSDPDNDPLTFTWFDDNNVQVGTGMTPTVPVALGLNTFTLKVSDGAATATSQVTVTVVDTEDPVADVATLPVVTGQCDATVSTVPTATDGCNGTINGTTTDPLYYDQQGTYTITWTYDDGNGNTSTQTQTVIVEDDTDPVLTVNAGAQLWSPNHTYHRFTLSQMIASVSDNCGTVSSYISSVTSDEEEDGIGDGNTLDDMVIVDCQTVDLRAERAGMRNGRVYTVYITAEDAVGNTTTVPYKVTVPKSASSGPAVEDAVLYTVTSACPNSPKGGVRTAATAVTLDLGQNYPNPFNPSTTIRYALPVDGHASLRVFDMTGAEVAVVFSGVQTAGAYAVEFDASALPSGAYMYRLEQAGTSATKLMQLMK